MVRGERTTALLREIASLPEKVLGFVSFGGLVILALTIGLFTLFLVHQLSLWISLDPERAFHGAKRLVTTYASVWNTAGNVWNSFVEVLLVAIPGWNSAAVYIVEPIVYTALDVFSVAFTRRSYNGIITEEAVPYEGYRCPVDGSMDKSSQWCGKVSFYSNQLGVASGSTSSFINNSTVVLSTQTARRLSEMTGAPLVGSLDLSFLMDALQSLLGAAIVILGELSDVVFHVVWTILSEVFELLFNLFITLVKALSSAVMMLVRSGLLQTVLAFGIDLLVVVLTEVLIPYLLAMLNAIMCLLDLTRVSGWAAQLSCIRQTCFQEGSDVFGEIFHTFSSIPPVARVVQRVFTRLLNPQTGQSYSSSSSGQVDVPDVYAGSAETPRTHACADCFTCQVHSFRTHNSHNLLTHVCVSSAQVPELRAIFLLAGTIYGCTLDAELYTGRVESRCMPNGTGYIDLCGPRGFATDLLTDAEWRTTYTLHRDFKDTMLQSYAGRFERLSVEQGGAGNSGNAAHRLATSWFERDVGLGQDQAAAFIRGVCRQMRLLGSTDEGPSHTNFQSGSMAELSMGLMYEHCKHAVGIDTCNVGFGQDLIDFSYEVSSCMRSQPQCLRDRAVCLGKCNGDGGSKLTQDFATTIVKQELSVSSIGSSAIARGRANCTVQNRVVEVPLFATGDAFRLYSARLRVRGGFTAVDVRACRREPAACAAIQRVLDKEPTLTYDVNTGRFRHAYSLTPPNPPPPPSPPPRLVQYSLASPPPSPAPPAPPPPWFEALEQCVVRARPEREPLAPN